MIKIYCKTAMVQAEQFNANSLTNMLKRYSIRILPVSFIEGRFNEAYFIDETKQIQLGDWIVTDGTDTQVMHDNEFKQIDYQLPVIPEYVAEWIEKCKSNPTSIGDMLCSERRPERVRDWMALTPGTYEFNQRRYSEHQDLVARAWLDGYQVEE